MFVGHCHLRLLDCSAKRTLRGIGEMLGCDVDFGEYLGDDDDEEEEEDDDDDDGEDA